MKKVLLIIAIATTSVTACAQESAPQVPPPKNVMDIKKLQLPNSVINKDLPKVKLPVPGTTAAVLTGQTWKFNRWWVTANIGHSYFGYDFKFLNGGTINCSYYVPDAKASLTTGTYSVRGNNINLKLKKDSTVTLTANLVYNAADNTLTGNYNLQVAAVANAPAGYTPGTISGDIKFEKQ